MTEQDSLKGSVEIVSEPWSDSAYYDDAERWTFIFWRDESVFKRLFNRLDLDRVLELAVGYGRHAEIVAPLAGRLTLMDVFDNNLEKCRSRLAAAGNILIVKNNGFDYLPVPDNSLTAIYCYDAMVHFSPDLVESYLKDTQRVLKSGGRALFHHSNYEAPFDRHYGLNPHARNHMSQQLFRNYAESAGLRIIESILIPWSDQENLDCLSLVEKP